jgi:hypothetical protein
MAGLPLPARAAAATTNPVQSLQVDVPPWDRRELKVLDLGIGNRRVKYGSNIRARLEIQDEHTEIELRAHTGDVLNAVRLSDWSGEQTRFVTAGEDHKAVVWNVHGKVVFELSEHTQRIGMIWELTGKRLATWSEDRTLIVWDTNTGRSIAPPIPTLCPPHRVCVDRAGEFFCLAEYWRARIVGVDGFELARLKWQFAPVASIRRLSSGRWLTQSNGAIKLWSSRGRLQHRIERPFGLEDGYLELAGEQLLTIDDAHYLDLFNQDGVKVGAREKDEALARDLRRFIRSRTKAREGMAARTSYEHFEHRTNPLAEPAAKTAAANVALSDDGLKERQLFTHFFERPDFRSIRGWLRDELGNAAQARERVEASLHADRARASKARFLQGFSIAVGAAALLLLAKQEQGDAQFVLALVAVVAAVGVMWTQLTVFAMDAAARILAVLPHETERLVSDVKKHRRRIIAGIPLLRAQAVYSGNEVRRQIRKTIAGLTKTALRECGVAEDDLLNASKAPIAISDWTALRLSEYDAPNPGISERNLGAFWWSQDGRFVFAVHSIQFVMLTERKIDIWTVEYDFIAGRAYNQTALTVYYGEITDVLQRRVSRPLRLGAESVNVEAAEVVLPLRSGGTASFTVLDDDLPALRSAVQRQTSAILADQLRNLDTEELARPRAADYSHEALKMEREFLRAEIDALSGARLSSVPQSPDPLEDIVACIKRQVLAHKAPPAA